MQESIDYMRGALCWTDTVLHFIFPHRSFLIPHTHVYGDPTQNKTITDPRCNSNSNCNCNNNSQSSASYIVSNRNTSPATISSASTDRNKMATKLITATHIRASRCIEIKKEKHQSMEQHHLFPSVLSHAFTVFLLLFHTARSSVQ